MIDSQLCQQGRRRLLAALTVAVLCLAMTSVAGIRNLQEKASIQTLTQSLEYPFAENSPLPCWITRPDGSLEWANSQFYVHAGLPIYTASPVTNLEVFEVDIGDTRWQVRVFVLAGGERYGWTATPIIRSQGDAVLEFKITRQRLAVHE